MGAGYGAFSPYRIQKCVSGVRLQQVELVEEDTVPLLHVAKQLVVIDHFVIGSVSFVEAVVPPDCRESA
jgi:hypothetical protein